MNLATSKLASNDTMNLGWGSYPTRSALRRTARSVGWPLLAFVILQANGCYPVLRFDSTIANWIFGAMFLCLPIVALFFATYVPRRIISRVAIAMLLAPILCLCAIEALVIPIQGRMVLVQLLPMDGYAVRVYTANYSDPSIEVRQELQLLPGLLLVRPLWNFNPADSANCSVVAKNTIVIDIPEQPIEGESTIPAQHQILKMRPHLYF